MPEPVNGFLYSSSRWDDFPFRDGDIIVATPAKCGTTWTQRILSLLIFDSPELYAPMSHISPWLDMNTRPLDDVVRELEAQNHRRFIKSHLDYDLLPHDDRVTYITVGRDPRDAAISWMHHVDNVDMDNLFTERIGAVGADDLADLSLDDAPDLNGTVEERFHRWIEGEGLENLINHIRTFWDHREQPNVVLLHYADLQRDLVGQMAKVAERLGIERSRARIEELAPFATFDEMKSHAAETAPNGDQSFWRSTDGFFRSGTSGQWETLMTEEEKGKYDARIAELCEPALADWLHRGAPT